MNRQTISAAFRAAFLLTIPIMTGFLFLGTTYGMLYAAGAACILTAYRPSLRGAANSDNCQLAHDLINGVMRKFILRPAKGLMSEKAR